MEEKPANEEQSWLYKIVILPKHLGKAIFDLLGKTETSEPLKFILGYMLLAALILIIVGIISPETVKAFFNYFFQ